MSGTAYSTATMPGGARAERSEPGRPLGIAGLCLLALALIWVVAELVPAVHLRDALALRDFTLLEPPPRRLGRPAS